MTLTVDLHLRAEGDDARALLTLITGDTVMADKAADLLAAIRANRDVTASAKMAFEAQNARLAEMRAKLAEEVSARVSVAADRDAILAVMDTAIGEVTADSADLAAAIPDGTPAEQPVEAPPAPPADAPAAAEAPVTDTPNAEPPVSDTPPAPDAPVAEGEPANVAPEPSADPLAGFTLPGTAQF